VGVSVKVYVQCKETSVSYKHVTIWNVTKANSKEKLKLATVLWTFAVGILVLQI